jgi:hypothetical protein
MPSRCKRHIASGLVGAPSAPAEPPSPPWRAQIAPLGGGLLSGLSPGQPDLLQGR